MRLPADLVERAIQLLRRGPLEAHQLADLLFPERAGRDIVAKRRSGHAVGRDLIARGVAVKLSDGTYALSPQMMSAEPQQPQEPALLEIEDGRVMRVRREVLGELPPLPEPEPEPRAYAAPAQCAPLPQAAPAPQQPHYAPPPQWTPPAQQAPTAHAWAPPTAPQPTVEQFKAWCTREWAAVSAAERDERWEDADRLFRAFLRGAYLWNRAFGWIPPNPEIEWQIASEQQPPPRAAPMRRPPPYASRPNHYARPW